MHSSMSHCSLRIFYIQNLALFSVFSMILQSLSGQVKEEILLEEILNQTLMDFFSTWDLTCDLL